jgi:hypothetical protein
MTTPVPSKEELLERAALRVAEDEAYVAFDFRTWTGGTLDWDAVSDFLHCARTAAVKVSLCRRPAPLSFKADASKIAALGGVDENLLIDLLRQAASLKAFRASGGSQLLVAARDAPSELAEGPDEEDK